MTVFFSFCLAGLSSRAANAAALSMCVALGSGLFGCSSKSNDSVTESTGPGSSTTDVTAGLTGTNNSTTQGATEGAASGTASSNVGTQSTSAGASNSTESTGATTQGSVTSTVGAGGANSTSSSGGGMTMTSADTTNTTDAGAGGTGGSSTLPPNPSGLPEPGNGGMARPSGAAGNLQVLTWAGFSGAISYSFDDANDTQINNEQQLLGLNVPFTWYLQTGKQQAANAFYQRALDAGHELANHTQQHGAGDPTNDVNQAQQFLMSQYGVTAYTMAAPNGSTNNYTSVAQQLFIIDRGVNDSLIGPDDNVDLLNLPSYIPPTGAGTGQLDPKVNAAVNQGKWQTVCIHGFSGGSDGAYQPIDLGGFVNHVEYAKSQDIWIGTMVDVGAYFIGRKAVASATPAEQGSDQVYTWTLPNVFPPGRYVRVTVDGGTLMQDGVALPWNEHGFYEVALDVGSLTLAP